MTELELNTQYNKWFTKNYSHLLREVKYNISNGQMSDYAEDLLHIVIEGLMGKTFEMKLQILQDNKIENWILKGCSFQIKSGTSPFYNHLRKYYDKHYGMSPKFDYPWHSELQGNSDNELYECFQKAMKELNWYEQKLIELKYYQSYTFIQLHKEFGLPLSTLKTEYQRVYNIIKEKCKHC